MKNCLLYFWYFGKCGSDYTMQIEETRERHFIFIFITMHPFHFFKFTFVEPWLCKKYLMYCSECVYWFFMGFCFHDRWQWYLLSKMPGYHQVVHLYGIWLLLFWTACPLDRSIWIFESIYRSGFEHLLFNVWFCLRFAAPWSLECSEGSFFLLNSTLIELVVLDENLNYKWKCYRGASSVLFKKWGAQHPA